MTFKESVDSVFGKFATATGRASRSEYWWWYLFTIILSCSVGLATKFMNLSTIPSYALSLVLLCPNICVGIRRCHDSGHSGWWIICPIVNIVMMFLPSDPEENAYGLPEGMIAEE